MLRKIFAASLLCGVVTAQLPPMNTLVNVTDGNGLFLRFCGGYLNTYVYAQPPSADPSGQSQSLQLVDSVCGDLPGAVSFASLTQQANYLAPTDYNGQSRLTLSSMQTLLNWPLKYDACFQPVASKPGYVSFVSLSQNPKYKGLYVSLATTNTGSCTGSTGGDVILAASGAAGLVTQAWAVNLLPPLPAPPAATLAINTTAVDHVIERGFMGCHIDPGFNQQTLNWKSSLIFGNSFDYVGGPKVQAWKSVSTNSAAGTAAMDNTVHVNPNANAPALKIDYQSGAGVVGYANGGIGYEGLSWQAGQEYEGFAIVLSPNGGTLYFGAHDRNNNTIDDSTTVTVAASSAWQRVNFTLTPSADAGCVGITIGSDPTIDCGAMGMNPGHACVRCAGEFVVGLAQPGTAWIGFVDFKPGSWGTFGPNGVAQKATVEAVQRMGVTAIRQGGSVSVGMAWKQWRGEWWERGAMQHDWNGDLVAVTWGELAVCCAAAGMIIRLLSLQTPTVVVMHTSPAPV